MTDNTTVNLYKLISAALEARPGPARHRHRPDNFPSDRYVIEGIAAKFPPELRMLDTDINQGLQPEQVRAVVNEDTAVVSLSHVAYRSGALADMEAITTIATRPARSCSGTCATRPGRCRSSSTAATWTSLWAVPTST